MVNSIRADINASLWAESSEDSSGNYNYNSPAATQCGISVCGVIPTDATSAGVNAVNYFRTDTDIAGAAAAYNGVLLGDLSAQTGFTATFSITDTALAPGAQFTSSDIVGETYAGEVGSNAGIRLFFGYVSPDGSVVNEWWSNPTAAFVTSMNNGADVTLAVNFDPSLWSNINGVMGNADVTDFDAALSDVTRLGLSFGSGYFFSDGFAFDTGGDAYIELDSVGMTPAIDTTPEPASILLLATLLIIVGYSVQRKYLRQQNQ
jgi:hypothetical protein